MNTNINRSIMARATTAALAVGAPASLSAQAKDVSSILNSFNSMLRSLADPAMATVSFLIGIAGCVMLIPAFVKFCKNEPTSSESISKVGIGMVVAYIIIQAIRMILLA